MRHAALAFAFLLSALSVPVEVRAQDAAAQNVDVPLTERTPTDERGWHIEPFWPAPEEPLTLPDVDTSRAQFARVFSGMGSGEDRDEKVAIMILPEAAGERLFIDANDDNDLTNDDRGVQALRRRRGRRRTLQSGTRGPLRPEPPIGKDGRGAHELLRARAGGSQGERTRSRSRGRARSVVLGAGAADALRRDGGDGGLQRAARAAELLGRVVRPVHRGDPRAGSAARGRPRRHASDDQPAEPPSTGLSPSRSSREEK